MADTSQTFCWPALIPGERLLVYLLDREYSAWIDALRSEVPQEQFEAAVAAPRRWLLAALTSSGESQLTALQVEDELIEAIHRMVEHYGHIPAGEVRIEDRLSEQLRSRVGRELELAMWASLMRDGTVGGKA